MDLDECLLSETDGDTVNTGATASCGRESSSPASGSDRCSPRTPRYSSSIKNKAKDPPPALAIVPYVNALELSSPTSSSSTLTTSTADRSTSATTLSQASTASTNAPTNNNDLAPQAAPWRGRRRQKALRRTKTGCTTCRRRKKKCDEARPECRNCVENNFECEGYAEPPVVHTRNNKEGLDKILTEPSTPIDNRMLKPINGFQAGIKSNLDHDLFNHFSQHVARTLTPRPSGTSDPFKKIVISMAVAHKPLMHSLLALSSAHMLKYKNKYKNVQEEQMRHWEHMSESITMLREHVEVTAAHRGDVADEMIASALMHYVITLMSGTYQGEHESHFQMARHYIRFHAAKNFGKFVKEFHDYYDALQRTSDLPKAREVETSVNTLPLMPGALDDLLCFTKPMQHIRNIIRERRRSNIKPHVDFEALTCITSLARWLNDWDNKHEPLSVGWLSYEIFRRAFDINLHRTMRASRPEPSLRDKVERGILWFEQLNDRVDQLRLLSALFLFGAAAFDIDHQHRISQLFDLMYSQIRNGNILHAKEVVQEVWRAMPEQDEGRSWDWENIKDRMGYNFHIV